MSTATKNPPTIPADVEHVVTLSAAQVAQHPDNLRDPGRDLDRLADRVATPRPPPGTVPIDGWPSFNTGPASAILLPGCCCWP